jgi:hypothetical protein
MALSTPITLGWREWVALPDLDLPAFKVKVDTGARTSAIHAHNVERYSENGIKMVSFSVLPVQRKQSIVRRCSAPLVDIRDVTDSGGHTETRHVIATRLELAGVTKEIEITLTERRDMLFRMLLGRTALAEDFLVNPALSFTCGRRSTRLLYSDEK